MRKNAKVINVPPIESNSAEAGQQDNSGVSDLQAESKLRLATDMSQDMLLQKNIASEINQKAPEDLNQAVDAVKKAITKLEKAEFEKFEQRVKRGNRLNEQEKTRYA